ncbi:HAD hydrolase-like protein [Actinomyces faecalis]|uniref:HAD hydrolase-like protein n=1 Tax=Actinomyces faecalis TaxID=2722820 RepID=UPI0015519A5D|nr:HAD hydrolase-like protein [Actinomyces faecalis]
MNLHATVPVPPVPDLPRPGAGQEVTAVLLDLDGTITDSAPVILDAVEAALTDLGLPVAGREELMSFIGPPLTEGFRLHAGLTGEDNASAVALYRQHYREHMHAAPVYDGIEQLLQQLAAWDVPLSLATSKREDYAVEILRHADLDAPFTVLAGADPADRYGSKEEVVRLALSRLEQAGADTRRVVHVGDRRHDVDGAHAAGLECVGVLWGYGDAAELAQADWLVRDPVELTRLVGRLTGRISGGQGED